jgi:LemA protein
MNKVLIAIVAIVVVAAIWIGSSYNSLNSKDEQVTAGWSEVLNQYQRRANLIPNLVETVKGYAAQEKDIFTQVAEARAKVGEIKITPEMLNNPELLKQFQTAQGELSGALSRLIAVSENYPDLKSDAVFRDLQAQLEGTENRTTVARNRYIEMVQDFNTTVRTFPGNVVASFFGFERKPNFTVEDDAAVTKPPQVNFNTNKN